MQRTASLDRIFFAALAAGLVFAAGCASGPFATNRPVSRERAIARCVEEIPAEAVPYGDLFAACMERQGWRHGGNPG